MILAIHILYPGAVLTVSGRQWRREGWGKRLVSVLTLYVKYRFRRRIEIAEDCYRSYFLLCTEQIPPSPKRELEPGTGGAWER